MSSSSSPADPHNCLVADASVAINLNATGCAPNIIRALPMPLAVTANALQELKSGLYNGHSDADQLETLINEGLVRLLPLTDGCTPTYEALIEGSDTLDDGEAATIALAVEISGVAVLDERKARRICKARFPAVSMSSTAEMLMHEAVAAALGAVAQIDAVHRALMQGRMHVPYEHIEAVVKLLGDRALECSSLPRSARSA